jgi:tetratricopeptide (TPR) repeat protein
MAKLKIRQNISKFNKKNHSSKFFLLFIISILFLSSCYKKQENLKNPFFIKAQKSYNEGNYNQSTVYYQKYLILYPESAKAHYNLASIYLEQENYILAIFHFKKFLTLEPNSPDRPIIEKWINASEASLYKELEKEYSDTEPQNNTNSFEDIKLENELNSLKKKNDQMKSFILRHKTELLKNELNKNLKNKPTSKNIKIARTYKVQSGDTLYKISEKMYNSYRYYKLIWQANKDKIKSPADLHPGDILTIPPIKKQ